MTASDRFWSKVDATGECWLWQASKTRGGYGQYRCPRPDGSVGMKRAHRVSYEAARGPIPEGMTLDHLCRTVACVRPSHLEVVSLAENIRRSGSIGRLASRQRARTHCKNGHEFTPDNTYVWRGHRHCRVCSRLANVRWLTKPWRDAGLEL